MMTYTDMNRITENVAFLQEAIYGSASISKTSWTTNDIIERSFWESMLDMIRALANNVHITVLTMTNDMLWSNINNVETLILNVFNTLSDLGITDFTVNSTSIVVNDVAELSDDDLLSAATISKWNDILGS